MAKPATRIVFMQAILLAGGAVVLGRSFWLQVVHVGVWQEKAENRRETDRELPARRGRILDRNGRPLAVTQEQYRIQVSLNQVRDTAALRAIVAKVLGPNNRQRVADEFNKPYPYFNGPFGAEQIEPLREARGVRLERVYNRQYPMQSLAGPMLGRLDQDGAVGIEGMEKALDTLLQGTSGREHFLKDARGKILAAGPPLLEPVAGYDVRLTIDADLQGIAEGALKQAVADEKAHGGDVVIVDARTGELLAVASLRTDTASGHIVPTSSAIVEPNQPGSTSKIFAVAAMLRTGTDTTPVEGEGGHWQQSVGSAKPRDIYDVHKLSGPVTVGMTVKYSSNIAISKFSLRLKPDQQYEAIRDFGFGAYPGVGFPGEAPGRLVRPSGWVNRLLTQPSYAQGYEWEATSLQIARGYGAIANHGVLMAPTLVHSVSDATGNVIFESRPDTIRHAVADSVAAQLMAYLHLTEDSGGTGAKAQLDRIKFPGKTGTAQAGAKGSGEYRGSFVAIFPEAHPQIVVYVMIDRPHSGKYYGGDVAAPVVGHVLQQALLATTSPIDRSWLSESAATRVALAPRPVESMSVRSVGLPAVPDKPAAAMAAVPDVTGQSARQAIVAMQRAGFQVRLVGRSRVRNTTPAAGDSLSHGALVIIRADSTS